MSCYLPTSWAIGYPEQGAKHEKHQRSKVMHSPFQRILAAQSRPDVPPTTSPKCKMDQLSIGNAQYQYSIKHCEEISLSLSLSLFLGTPKSSELPRWTTFWLAQDQRPLKYWNISTTGYIIWLVVWIFLFFHRLGIITQLTNIFQRGWNHQLVMY